MSEIAVGPATEESNGRVSEHLGAAKTSPLMSVRERIAQARRKRIWDDEIPYTDYVVRYGPISEERRQEIGETRSKEDKKLRVLLSSADVLASACIGIFEKVDGKLVNFDPSDRGKAHVESDTDEVSGEPLTFASARTQDLLGVEGGTAISAVQAFYPTDGDVISASDEVIKMSRFIRAEIAGDLGN